MSLRCGIALTVALALAGCRGALGISDLDVESDAGEGGGASGASTAPGTSGRGASSGSGGGTAGTTGGKGGNQAGTSGAAGMGRGGSGGGKASTSGTGSASGSAGTAGSSGGPAGASGTGSVSGSAGTAGSGGGSADAVKACQTQCRNEHPDGASGHFFDVLHECSCESGEVPSCEEACNSCAVKGSDFEGQTASCIACLAAKLEADECKEPAKDCKGECKEFAKCLEACGSP